jgi:DNA primase large subunit
MRRLHARYPFLRASREAVEAADVELGELFAEGGPAVERGRERVERALLAGDVTTETRRSPRVELLSYPVARVLVSLLDTPGAVGKYAAAEATLAHRRFTEDFDDDARLQSTDRERLSLEAFLRDFDLGGRVHPTGEGDFLVDVTAYLQLATSLEGGRWRLVSRDLHEGRVPVRRTELYTLLREAVRRRVEDGLPLSVPEAVAEALTSEVNALRTAVADVTPEQPPAVVDPESFPPCVEALLSGAESGDLDVRGRFALVSFLSGLDIDADELVSFCGDGEEAESLRYQFDRLADERGAAFPPPSCATMQAFGLCVSPEERDELCAEIAHPLSYYTRRVREEGTLEG